MKSQRKILSLVLALSTLFCCLTNLYVKAAEIDVSDCTYVVDNMTFYRGGKQISSLEDAAEVAVDVTRRVAGGDSDRLIISTYSDTGEYIGMYSVTHYVEFGRTSNVKVLLNIPKDKVLGEVKAYVWKSLYDMTPLSNVLSSKNNMTIDPKLEYEKEVQTEFTDVSVNDSFADAVSLMAYLGIMNGYEDKTFRPTSNLRVADAARIITYMTKGEFLASLLESEELVADEIPSSIERGYINYCVDSKYLIPNTNGYVNYDTNITVKDFLILTMNALGYYKTAKASGGWPRGYITLATDLGFENLEEYNYSADITRAEAAAILAHAVNAPILTVVGFTYSDSGEIIEKYEKQDGIQSQYYKSILTENFGIYTVEGFVTETYKDNGGLKADEVNFGVALSKRYSVEDLQFYGSISDYNEIINSYDRILYNVNVGETDAANHKGIYATALLKLDENYNWSLVKFTPSDKNNTITFDRTSLDTSDYEDAYGNLSQSEWEYNSSYLKFFKDGDTTSTKYSLDDYVSVFVNGVKVTSGDPVWEYVINGDIGEIKLVDTYKTDGKIDAIHVNSYVSGMIDGINFSTGKIALFGADDGISSITLDPEDDMLEYHIYYNGEEISIDELQQNDVLTIAYDVTAGYSKKTSLAYSYFYDIYVSRDVVNGVLKGKDSNEYEAKFGDKYYQFASPAKYMSFDMSSKLGDEYTLYLDAFGRVFKAEIRPSVGNFAIAEKFTLSSTDDDYKLTMFTAEGTTKTYYFDASKATVTSPDGMERNIYTEGSEDGLNTFVKNLIYVTGNTKKAIENRVIQYKVSSSTGMITELKFIAVSSDTLGGTNGKEEFKARSNTIGAIKMNEDTKIIDSTRYVTDEDLSPITVANLTDEVAYKAYAYGTKIDGFYPFVLITEADISPLIYAIAEDFQPSSSIDTAEITLFNINSANRAYYSFDAENSKITDTNGNTKYTGEFSTSDDFCDSMSYFTGSEQPVQNRVVSYRINYHTYCIEEISFLPYSASTLTGTGTMGVFDAKTNKIGNIALAENARITDTSDLEYTVSNIDSLIDGSEFEAYAYNMTDDLKAQFVIVTATGNIPVITPTEVSGLAIAEKFTLSVADDEYKLTVFTADGTRKTYYFDAGKATVTLSDGTEKNKSTEGSEAALNELVRNMIYVSGNTKNAIENRVVQYKVSSASGMITELKFIAPDADTSSIESSRAEFSERNNTIGTIKIGEDTKIFDAIQYFSDNSLYMASVSNLADGVAYRAYAYGTKVDGLYQYILITEAEQSYNANTRFAVVTEDGYTEEMDDETGDIVYCIKAMYGEAKKLIVSEDVSTYALNTLKKGDVIYFKTNAKGQITAFNKLFSFTAAIPAQDVLAANSLVNESDDYSNLTGIVIEDTFGANFSSDFTTAWTGVSNDAIQLIYGPVIDRTDADVTIGIVDANGKTNTLNNNEAVVFDLAKDINVYTYDYSMGKDSRFDYSISPSAIAKSNIVRTNYEADGYTIDWNKVVDGELVNQKSVNFAFAVVAEGEVVDIFEFIAK